MMFPTLLKPIKNILQRRPILAIFEATLRCNSACGYCDLPLNQGRYEMSRAEISRVFSHLYEEGLRIVFVQGGEPLLRKDLPDILDDLSSIGFTISLITNGTKLTSGLLARIARHPISISISLDVKADRNTDGMTSYTSKKSRGQFGPVRDETDGKPYGR